MGVFRKEVLRKVLAQDALVGHSDMALRSEGIKRIGGLEVLRRPVGIRPTREAVELAQRPGRDSRSKKDTHTWLGAVGLKRSFIFKFSEGDSFKKDLSEFQAWFFGKRMPLTMPPLIEFRTVVAKSFLSFTICSAASLFNGSFGFGSINKKIKPRITELISSTGFQSERRMFKHTFPSRSMFGCQILSRHS